MDLPENNTFSSLKPNLGEEKKQPKEKEPQISNLTGRTLHQPLVLLLPPQDVFPPCPSFTLPSGRKLSAKEAWHVLVRKNIHAPGVIQLKERNIALVGEKEKESYQENGDLTK